MSTAYNRSALVVGIGNRFRSDDAFGCLVSEELRREDPLPYVDYINHSGEPASLISSWRGYQLAILVDTVSSGKEAGVLYNFDLISTPLPDHLTPFSTHAFGIPQAIELARALNRLPSKLLFVGAEGKNYDAGTHLSPALIAAKRLVKQKVTYLLKRYSCQVEDSPKLEFS